jgi:hypothetical protein
MRRSISNIKRKRRVGLPQIGSKGVYVRIPPVQFAKLDAWIARHPDPKPTVPEALRRLAEKALTCAAESGATG